MYFTRLKTSSSLHYHFTSSHTSKPLIYLTLHELVCALSGYRPLICPLQHSTSSTQISALLSPAQLLKVGPRRNCRKATLAICFIWNPTMQPGTEEDRVHTYIWPHLDLDGEGEASYSSFVNIMATLFSRVVAVSLVFTADSSADFAWHGYVVCFHWSQLGHWWPPEKMSQLSQNLNTSNNTPYPQPISLSPTYLTAAEFSFQT